MIKQQPVHREPAVVLYSCFCATGIVVDEYTLTEVAFAEYFGYKNLRTVFALVQGTAEAQHNAGTRAFVTLSTRRIN